MLSELFVCVVRQIGHRWRIYHCLFRIMGLFVGIAAFLGGFMSWNFVMAGTASGKGLYFAAAAILLILAWKTAGYYGLDRFVPPRLGTPWRYGWETATPLLKPVRPVEHSA